MDKESGAMAHARLQLGPEGYRIAVGDQYSAEFDYGVPAEVLIDGVRYIGHADVATDEVGTEGPVESELEFWLYKAVPVEGGGEPEDVVEGFGGDEGDEGDEEEGEAMEIHEA